MIFKCPDGHDSTTNDFCSDCGLEMRMPAAPGQTDSAETAADLAPREPCPSCQTERDGPQTVFCGVCGYNFMTGQKGNVVSGLEPAPAPVTKTLDVQPEPAFSVSAAPHLEIEVAFDESNPEAPKGMPSRKFSLYDEESLIGRRSRSIPQTIGLEGDDCISRRHLLIIRQADGSYVVRLFDNTNGGTLNGTEMTAGVELALAEGDQLVIGAFTSIRVTAIR